MSTSPSGARTSVRWFSSGLKSALRMALLMALLALAGCIPVTIIPDRDAAGKPIPVAVAQTQPPPESPRQDFADVGTVGAAATTWSSLLAMLGLTGTALTGTGVIFAMRSLARHRHALRAAVDFGREALAVEPFDEAEQERLKSAHAEAQARAGIRPLIQAALRATDPNLEPRTPKP